MLPVFFSSNTIPVLLLLSPLTGEGPYHYDWVNIFSSAISPQGFLQQKTACLLGQAAFSAVFTL